MNYPSEFDNIVDYKNGHMSEAGQKAFEEGLVNNGALQKELGAVRAQDDIMV